MNRKVLKSPQVIIGFVLSFLFEVIGIVLATMDNSYWVTFVVLGIILMAISVHMASRITDGIE